MNSRIIKTLGNSLYYEYTKAADIKMPEIKAKIMKTDNLENKTKIDLMDYSDELQTDFPATSPVCLVGFVYIQPNESIQTEGSGSSNVFVVLRGKGKTQHEAGEFNWKHGDVFTLPKDEHVVHSATEDTLLYWVTDEPIFNYLGASPKTKLFPPTFYSAGQMACEAKRANSEASTSEKNRTGILLANENTPLTETITPSLWSLYNTIEPGEKQKAHRHNSVALDLCLFGPKNGSVYTLMGPTLNENGKIENPVRIDWATNAAFVTPPRWWHTHHNESDETAIVFPVQDAGLQTYMRTLFIEFSSN